MSVVDDAIRKILRKRQAEEEDVIYRSDAIRAALNVCKSSPSKTMRVLYSISVLPSAQKKGKWIDKGVEYNIRWTCSECGRRDTHVYNYCPDCGADMRGESDE